MSTTITSTTNNNELSPIDRDIEYNRLQSTITTSTNYYLQELNFHSTIDYWQYNLLKYSNNQFLQSVHYPNIHYTYQQTEYKSNQIANWAIRTINNSNNSSNTERAVICLLAENSCEYLFIWLGLAKLGYTIALINTELVGQQLLSSILTANSIAIIISTKYRLIYQSAIHQALDAAANNNNNLYQSVINLPVYYTAAGAAINNADTIDSIVSNQSGSTSYDYYLQYRNKLNLSIDHPLFYIYTSGTTGISKAAYFSHRRFIGAGITWSTAMKLIDSDKYYITLPLYHGNAGCVAISSIINTGSTAIIRDKFSVRSFWIDIELFKCTAMIYVGELWRYIYNYYILQSQLPITERSESYTIAQNNTLRVIAGNGLTTSIWQSIIELFHIQSIVEHYGMTEMPAGPYINCYGRIGACGYIPITIRQKLQSDKLIEYDLLEQKPVRDSNTGFCREITAPNQPGECIFLLAHSPEYYQLNPLDTQNNPHVPIDIEFTLQQHQSQSINNNPYYKPYNGYTDSSASIKRVYRSVFTRNDAWFSTGDLLRTDSDGFIYFLDRCGDSYRWKGQNIACNEIAEIVTNYNTSTILTESNSECRILECNVYGVHYPNRDGRAGMLALLINNQQLFNLQQFYQYLYSKLPTYAIPIFIRLLSTENSKTSTLKLKKVELSLQGFNPSNISNGDLLLVLSGIDRTYIPLTSMEKYEELLLPNYRGYEPK